jgi:hypothetical protein
LCVFSLIAATVVQQRADALRAFASRLWLRRLQAKEDWMHVLRFRAFVVVVVCAMASSVNAQNQSAEELSMTGSRRSTA